MKPIDPNALYVGTNYHPHDWPADRWVKDLDMMAEHGFNVVRLGHLCWDSFEPEEGVFDFAWMDRVMDLCAERGIGVFLDLPTRPAPTWLHRKFPSIDIVDRHGVRQNAHFRYMDDVGDPHFQEYAYRMAAKLAKRYAPHPALLAFGLCNELGSGFGTYSPTARERFIAWLKKRYRTLEALNSAWASHRWSRKLQSFEQIEFPIGSEVIGAPERYLDMQRFFSHEIVEYMAGLKAVANQSAPGVPISSNHWSENPQLGFDYLHNWPRLTDYPGQGFYPGVNPEDVRAVLGACFINAHRSAENPLLSWNLEFQVSGCGSYACPPDAMRMYAYLAYLYGSQAMIAWTWRAMLGGEEQYLFGLLDHDGEPSWKLEEFRQIAAESRQMEQRQVSFHRRPAEAAIAYSYEDVVLTARSHEYYQPTHQDQAEAAFAALHHLNRDCVIVDPRRIENRYPVVIFPGVAMITPEVEATIRRLLEEGATVIMTAYSAKVNEHNQVFDCPLPGNLSDVFGIRVKGYDRAKIHVSAVNLGGVEKTPMDRWRRQVSVISDGAVWAERVNYHEFLELTTAIPLAEYVGAVDLRTTAVSCNAYGKGRAIYIGIPAEEGMLRLLLEWVCGLGPAFPGLPMGIAARTLRSGETLYVNTTDQEMTFPIKGGESFFTGRQHQDELRLTPYGVEMLTTAKT